MDIGIETRVIVSECRYVMDVEDAVGKKVLVVANMPVKEVLGVQSHGEWNPLSGCRESMLGGVPMGFLQVNAPEICYSSVLLVVAIDPAKL